MNDAHNLPCNPDAENQHQRGRIASIDVLRGIVMIIMALDHVRDFVHRGAMSALPTNLESTTPVLFASRWITHICAPAFALTAGVAAWLWLQGSRSRSRGDLSKYLIVRGLLLMLLELSVMRVAYYFSWSPDSPVLLLVLWSLGLSMVALAALIWLPARLVGLVAVGAILAHPLLDGINANQLGPAKGLWNIVHQVGAFQIGQITIVTPYPLIPWMAIMALGFALAPIFKISPDRRARIFWMLGGMTLLAFVVLRQINMYGDPVPWSVQADGLFTVMSFFNTSKYPASPAFLLMTLGLIFVILAYLERHAAPSGRKVAAIATLGQVPLFYYIVHFYAAHLVATLLAVATYGSSAFKFIFLPFPSLGGSAERFPNDFGHNLWVTYFVWLTVLAICYPLCKWFARIKTQGRKC